MLSESLIYGLQTALPNNTEDHHIHNIYLFFYSYIYFHKFLSVISYFILNSNMLFTCAVVGLK
jgi:hypothetical protein